jgi:hypothetical protein
MSEKIWYQDISNFFYKDAMFRILPLQSMTLEEKINAIIRFFIYLGIILSLVLMDARYLFMGIIALVLSYPIYEFDNKERNTAETFLKSNDIDIIDNKPCTRSSVENPFMNPTIVDIGYKPDRPEACNISTNQNVKDLVKNNFDERVFKDYTDIWGRQHSSREFYTVASTTIPNKQGEFAEWLYGSAATCKEGNMALCETKNYRHILR